MTLPAVYPILDTATIESRAGNCLQVADALLQTGARILQYRHKGFWSAERFAAARAIALLCRIAGVRFIINDRADFAAILNSEGIPAGLHIGQDDLTIADARAVIGPVPALGFSTHNASQMTEAQQDNITYAAFGPVFGTTTKLNPDPTTGIDSLRTARALTTLPLVAIGGITLENARLCWEAGADSVAVISAVTPNPCTAEAVAAAMHDWLRIAPHTALY